MNRLATLDELVSAVLRHIVLLALVIAFGVTASIFYALSLPRSFETTAIIQIEQSKVTQETLGGAATANSQTLQQLQIIEQRVMARGNLLGIINELNLFSEIPNMSDNDKVNALRRAARVTRVADPSLAWRPDISPTALNITVQMGDPELATLVANRLVDNVLEQNRLRREASAQQTLNFFQGEESRVGDAIIDLEEQIADFKRDNADFLTAGLDSQREQLAGLREAELTIEREILEINTNTRGSQTAVIANRAARLEEQRALIQARIERVGENLRLGPEVERELSGLERQLQKLEDQYEAITRNQAEAEMSLALQESQQGESFHILERAVVPDLPFSPNRKRIAMMGCILSGFAGIVLVILLELRNPVIRTEAQLIRRLGLQPVAVIPNVQIARERAWRRAFWVLGILAFVIAVILVAAFVSAR